MRQPVRTASVRSALTRGARLRSAPLRSAPLRSAPVRFALKRNASLRFALARSAPLRSASSLRFASTRSALPRFALKRNASLRFALARFAPLRSAPLRSALLRSGRMSGFSRRHAFHAFTPCLRIATCSLFAMEAHPVSGERYHVVASLALALLAGPGPTRRALSAVAYLLRFAAAPDARTIARRQEHGRRHPPAEGISGHDNHRAYRG